MVSAGRVVSARLVRCNSGGGGVFRVRFCSVSDCIIGCAMGSQSLGMLVTDEGPPRFWAVAEDDDDGLTRKPQRFSCINWKLRTVRKHPNVNDMRGSLTQYEAGF